MPVYVDNAFIPFGRMLMSHMMADTDEELHQMADKIGVDRKWFQEKVGLNHYDICKSKRALALKAGAVELTPKVLLSLLKEVRHAKTPEL